MLTLTKRGGSYPKFESTSVPGTKVHNYAVTGPAEEIEEYKTIKGKFLPQSFDDGAVRFTSPSVPQHFNKEGKLVARSNGNLGPVAELVITTNGKGERVCYPVLSEAVENDRETQQMIVDAIVASKIVARTEAVVVEKAVPAEAGASAGDM